MSGTHGAGTNATDRKGSRRIFRRGPWETVSMGIIGAGIVMLMQPFALVLYTYSFVVILAGSVSFVVTSHFPE